MTASFALPSHFCVADLIETVENCLHQSQHKSDPTPSLLPDASPRGGVGYKKKPNPNLITLPFHWPQFTDRQVVATS